MKIFLITTAIIGIAAGLKVPTTSFNVVQTPFASYSTGQVPYSGGGPSIFGPSSSSSKYNFFPDGGYNQLRQPFASMFSAPSPPGGGKVKCPQTPTSCPKTPYRTLDGSCNNVQNPSLGVANSRYSRLLSPRYGDGVQAPTTSVTGEQLPNARAVSLIVFGERDIPDPDFTLVNMQWGQIITHDMSMQAGGTQSRKHETRCCTDDGKLIPTPQAHSTCFPILVPPNDPAHQQTGTECMNFVRTLTDGHLNCQGYHVGQPAEQLTVVTPFMDLSLVYGNSEDQNQRIRAFVAGRMVVDQRGGYEWPPQNPNITTDCDVQNSNEHCYLAGDVRVNQNTGLTVLQIILLREHNRIADVLGKLNPHWDDERLFQEARKINIGQYVHISYYEWLPIFLGWDNMLKNRLIYKTTQDGYVNDYDPSVDPRVINSHATAAFRYFHSQIEGRLDLISELRSITGALRLSDWLNRPAIIEAGDNYDSLVRGLATQPEELTDINFDAEIKHFLFRRGRPFGMDLRALDIQRNRDHGLASYNDFREFCGLPRAHSWEGFLDLISPKSVEDLKTLYNSHEDVEITVGGSLEAHVAGALAGPTFLCILTEQFYRTRVGDRFFFERGDKTGFSREQLAEIRKASIARLMCDNGNHVHSIQRRAFIRPTKDNAIVPCAEIPVVDLRAWQEVPAYEGHSQASPSFFNGYNYK